MGRPRKSNRHLPANMQHKHGAYYFVKAGKWTPLGKDYGQALKAYADLVGDAVKVRTIHDAMWGAIEHALHRTYKAPITESTAESYRRSAALLDPVFGHMALEDLEADDVVRYIVNTGTVTANRNKALLSLAYSYARVVHGYKGADPTKRLGVRVQETPRDRYVTDSELALILSHASPKLRCMARFLELTGMRQGDALKVRMADLDDEGFSYYNTKSKKWQGLEWSPELTETVEDAKRLWRRFGREWLFESRPKGKHAGRGIGPYTPSGFRSLWDTARTKAGLRDVRLHDLRAKAGSDAATLDDASALMGHADTKVTKRHYRRKPVRLKPLR